MRHNCSLIKLIIQKLKHEKFVLLIFAICLYVIIAVYTDSIKIPCKFSLETISKINKLAFNFALSYISAFIFYILTILLPQTLRARALLPNVVEELRAMQDLFYDFSIKVCGNDWIKTDDIKPVVNGIVNKYHGSDNFVQIKNNFIRYSQTFVKQSYKYIVSIMSYESYLTPKECDMLVQIRNCFAFSYIQNHFDSTIDTYCDCKTLEFFIQDLIGVNKKINQLYKDMSRKYGFDFQQDLDSRKLK